MILRLTKYAFALVFVLLSASACAYSDTVRSTMIGFSDFRQIEPKLYVSPGIDRSNDQEIISLILGARDRITKQFGAPISRPTIIFTQGEKEQKEFKLYGIPGKALFAPWGNYVILNKARATVDVTAHELVHAEIAERLGYFVRLRKMPTWLDEGIAMQVDHRPRYSQLKQIDQSEFRRVMSLDSPKLFWSQDREQNIENYRSSKVAVREGVLPTIGKKGLYKFLEEIRMGKKVQSLIKKRN